MGLFDIFSDAKDSMDRSRQAREYLSQAKQYVREGEEIYNRAYHKVSSYAAETEYKLREHTEYKKRIAKDLGSNIGNTLRNFSQFDIDSKTISTPPIQNIQVSGGDLSVFSSAVSSCMPQIEIPSIFDMFISDDDYYEARRQRDEAKQYKQQMKYEREKLNNYKEKMSEIRSFITSERNELDSLMDKIKKMTNELEAGMKKNNFSKEEAEYLKGIHKITEYVAKLLSTQFLNDTFSITEKYQKAFDGVKNINQNLPYAPSVSDTTTRDAIRRIAGGTIVF